MRHSIRIFWCIGSMIVLTAYLLQGFSLSTTPEAMSWNEFSANPQAMQHYAERNGIDWDGSPEQTEALRKNFEENTSASAPQASTATVASSSWTARIQRVMHSLYHFWQPRRDPSGRHVHHVFRFSPVTQLRWNIGMTLALFLAFAAVLTAGVSSLERKARA